MILSVLYHRIGSCSHATLLNLFEEHCHYYKNNYDLFLPKELTPKSNGLVMTFDDATYDFYHYCFPIIKEQKIKVLLAVIPSMVSHAPCHLLPNERIKLLAEHSDNVNNGPKEIFCNLDELKEIAACPYIEIASHGYSHASLDAKNCNLDNEIIESKKCLETWLNTSIHSFVLPYGKYSKKAKKLIEKHYDYCFRIGSSYNLTLSSLMYRIVMDGIEDPESHLKGSQALKYTLKYYYNKIRNK